MTIHFLLFASKFFILFKDEQLLHIRKNLTLNFMAPFYGWGSTASRLQSLRGGSLLLTIQFPESPGIHFIDLGRMKG